MKIDVATPTTTESTTSDDSPPASTVRVAMLGRGTVGRALHELVVDNRERLHAATGRHVDVTVALVRDADAAGRGALASDIELVTSIDDVLAARPDVVVEAMGTVEPARSYVLAALANGIPVVTANKQLLARHGDELHAAAASSGTQLRFEASVCGAIPIIRMVRESLAPSRIEQLLGILNGTTNYMLTAMTTTGHAYADALAEAQRLGFAEPDPTEDVEGLDAAAKLAILASIAFDTPVDPAAIETTGISGITAEDVTNAGVLGCRIKLIARARIGERADADDRRSMTLTVTPMLVPEEHPLANVSGATNAVLVDGEPFGQLVVQGAGAGGPETASALAGDLVSVVIGSGAAIQPLRASRPRVSIAASTSRRDRWYVRMVVPDLPGVLASVAGALAAEDVSIERVLQQRAGDGRASLVLTTHPTTGASLTRALEGQTTEELTVLPMLDDEATT